MAVFFNWLGLAWLIFGLGAAIALQNLHVFVHADGKHFLEVLVLVITCVDIAYRLFISRSRTTGPSQNPNLGKQDVATHWLLAPSLGGSLMFLPAWATALVAYIVATIISAL